VKAAQFIKIMSAQPLATGSQVAQASSSSAKDAGSTNSAAVDLAKLPWDMRERLAQLELELSEGWTQLTHE
jgi:hypothetical protein